MDWELIQHFIEFEWKKRQTNHCISIRRFVPARVCARRTHVNRDTATVEIMCSLLFWSSIRKIAWLKSSWPLPGPKCCRAITCKKIAINIFTYFYDHSERRTWRNTRLEDERTQHCPATGWATSRVPIPLHPHPRFQCSSSHQGRRWWRWCFSWLESPLFLSCRPQLWWDFELAWRRPFSYFMIVCVINIS